MSLDQDLKEIEPILRGTEGTFQFTHPSFQEVLTAKQFANEINSGRLSVRDAYVNFWSYEEDAELWDLPKDREWRALLPDWIPIIRNVDKRLSEGKSIQLKEQLEKSHLKAHEEYKKKFPEKNFYNPFPYDELDYIGLGIDQANQKRKEAKKKKMMRVIKLFTDNFTKNIEKNKFIPKKIIKNLRQGQNNIWMKKFIDYNFKKPEYNRSWPILFESLYDIGTEDVVEGIAYCIRKICESKVGTPSDYNPILSKKIPMKLKNAIELYAFNPENEWRDYAAMALAYQGEDKTLDILVNHLNNIADPGNNEIVFTIESIAAVNTDKSAETLIDLLEKIDSSPNCTNWFHILLKCVANTNNPQAIGALRDYMMDKVNLGWTWAALELAKAGDEKALDFLIDTISEPNHYEWYLDYHTATELAKLNNPKLKGAFIKYIRNPKNNHRYSACSALGIMGCHEAADDVAKYISESEDEDKFFAVEALGKIGNEKHVDVLISYLKETSNKNNDYAGEALGRIGGEKTILTLVNHIKQDRVKNELEDYRCLKGLSLIRSKKALKEMLQFLPPEDDDNYHARLSLIKEAHDHLKPRGYNPSVKRLAA